MFKTRNKPSGLPVYIGMTGGGGVCGIDMAGGGGGGVGGDG